MVAFITAAWGDLAWMLEPFREDNGMDWLTVDGIEHPSNFSRKLIGLLEGLDAPVIFWSCVGTFFDRPLSVLHLESLARYMVKKGDVVRMGVGKDGYPWRKLEAWEGLEIGECADLSLCSTHAGAIMDCALFHRDNLLKILEPCWTIWEIERRGTEKILADPSLRSLAIRPGLFRYAGLSDNNERGQLWPLGRLFSNLQRARVATAAPEGVAWKSSF